MTERVDVAVIGGGISGCAAAWNLARRGAKVALFEQGEIAQEQSRWAWGAIRRQGRHPAELPLAHAAMDLWATLGQELGVPLPYRRGGFLTLGETAADEAWLWEAAAAARGFGGRLVGPEEVSRLVPGIGGEWRIGLYTPDDGYCEPLGATRAFAEAAVRLGVRIHEQTPVLDVIVGDGRVRGLVTQAGAVDADHVVCAAGINGSRFARRLGIAIPMRGIRSVVSETYPAEEPLGEVAVWTPRIAFRPTARNSFCLGSGYREPGGDYDFVLSDLRDLRPFLASYAANARRIDVVIGREFIRDLRAMMTGPALQGAIVSPTPQPRLNLRKRDRNKREFDRVMPSFAPLRLQDAWSGRIDVTPDALPALGELRTARGFVVATGFSGHGLALGPVTGRLLAELVLDGRASLDLSAFDPHRFADGAAAVFQRPP